MPAWVPSVRQRPPLSPTSRLNAPNTNAPSLTPTATCGPPVLGEEPGETSSGRVEAAVPVLVQSSSPPVTVAASKNTRSPIEPITKGPSIPGAISRSFTRYGVWACAENAMTPKYSATETDTALHRIEFTCLQRVGNEPRVPRDSAGSHGTRGTSSRSRRERRVERDSGRGVGRDD